MWIFGTNYSPTSDHALKFNKLVEEFKATKNKTLVQEIFMMAQEIAKTQREAFPDLKKDESFDVEMALNFIDKCLIQDMYAPSAARKMKGLAYKALRKEIDESGMIYISGIDLFSYSCDPGGRLRIEEHLAEAFEGVPLRIRSAVLYLLYFPERFSTFKDFCPSLSDRITIVRVLYKLKSAMNSTRNLQFDFQLPTTQISRLLLVSALYKKSPLILVLMLLFKDITPLLQFCTLFEGETVEIPQLDEILKEISRVSNLTTRLEDKDIAVRDRESLAYLATELDGLKELDEEATLNPVLSTFFENIFRITLRNYDDFQQKLIQQVNLGDTEDILRVYEVMNQEIATQINLLTQISSAIGDRKDVEQIVESLRMDK